VENVIHRRWPRLQIYPYNYPPHPTKTLISQIIVAAQFSVIGVTLGGEYVFPLLSITPPAFFQQMKGNKISVCMGAWIVGNMISQNLKSTGAFEVVYKGKVLFSKLKQNRLPTVDEILKPIEKLGIAISSTSSPSSRSSTSRSSSSNPSPNIAHKSPPSSSMKQEEDEDVNNLHELDEEQHENWNNEQETAEETYNHDENHDEDDTIFGD